MKATRRPRVLFVGAFPPPGSVIFGGMITSCRALLGSSLPQRLELYLLDSTQISNPPPRLAVRLLLAARRFVRFITTLERRHPDAVLLFVAVGASIVEKGAMAWYARTRGVPVIMFPRGGSVVEACRHSARTLAWVRVAFRGARKIICQGDSWRRFAIESLGFAPDDVTVIRNWTATRELVQLGADRSDDRSGKVRLLFLGWLERDKGIFELIEACARLTHKREFTLELAGEGSASEEIRALVLRSGLDAVVRFRGWLRDEELRQTLAGADVLVLPSWAEGLPNAMVEGMAARLAIVVSRVGAVPEVIQDHRSGLLVAPRNVDSLVTALCEIIDNPDLRKALADEAFRVATHEFEVESAVARLVDEVNSVVSARHGYRSL
jgi:glycosyltransferase involved in cell wall biosynthesis